MESSLELFVRYFLGGYFTFIAVFYSARLILNKSGSTLTHLGETGSSHWIGHIAFRVFRLLIWTVCVVRIFFPEIDVYLIVFSALKIMALNLTGIALMISGFCLILACHIVLGNDWRLGIDPEAPKMLIKNKIYARTRNPIFIGVLAGQLGFFLALPSAFSLICLIIGLVSIINQVKLEEAYLQHRFAEAYQDYCQNVPRWF